MKYSFDEHDGKVTPTPDAGTLVDAKADNRRPVHADPELLDYWRTLPAPSNERLAVEIIEALQRELAEWTQWGIIEIAVRNPSVADYCKHWEGRAEKAEIALASSQKEVAELREALEESVKLQSHYANLLNMHDGGHRIGFANASEWLRRIAALKDQTHPTGTAGDSI